MAIPCDEAERSAALGSFEILDTSAEQLFDDFTQLAAQICDCPISLVGFVDKQRLWFKSKRGLDLNEIPLEVAFCAQAISTSDDVQVVENTVKDPRFSSNPLVIGDSQVRFYAGAPLITSEGQNVGSLCVMDRQPRKLGKNQIEALRMLARQVVSQLEARKSFRLLAETATDLEDQRREMQHILDHVPALVIYKDTKNTILRVNKAASKSLGIEIEKIEGHSAKGVLPKLSEKFYCEDLEVIRSGQPKLGHIQQIGSESTGYRWVQIDRIPISNEKGDVERLLVLALDITELKNTEDSLRESQTLLSQANVKLEEKVLRKTAELSAAQERYEDLYQNAPDMYISIDPENSHVLQCNQTLLTELGYQREEIIGHEVTKLHHPNFGKHTEILRHFRTFGYLHNIEMTLARKDGSTVFVSMNSSAIRDDQGKIIASRSAYRDLTELKRLKKNVKLHRDQLTHLSRVATMNEIATGIAHELNQPLQAIKNYSQGALLRMKRQTLGSVSLMAIFKEIVSDADRAAELISSLRRYVKANKKQASLVKPIDLVTRVAKLLTRELEQHGATLTIDAVDTLQTIPCDAVQIEQVLINLLLNAAEAMSESGTENRLIQMTLESTPHETIRFAIVDQGLEATEVDLDRIFDTFFTTKNKGLGMGLSICRTIVESHGGTLLAKANQGPGLTFSFELPVTES